MPSGYTSRLGAARRKDSGLEPLGWKSTTSSLRLGAVKALASKHLVSPCGYAVGLIFAFLAKKPVELRFIS